MKIIKQGVEKVKEIKKTCYNCKTKFSFTKDEIQHDREGPYVICPSCGAFIGQQVF